MLNHVCATLKRSWQNCQLDSKDNKSATFFKTSVDMKYLSFRVIISGEHGFIEVIRGKKFFCFVVLFTGGM
jgi:hypothetical protein